MEISKDNNEEVKLEYISVKEAMEILNLHNTKFYNAIDFFDVKKIGVCKSVKYSKIDILSILKEQEIFKANYLSKNEARKLLGLSEGIFLKMIKEFEIKPVTYAFQKNFYPKDEIYFFKEQQAELGKRYISKSMVKKQYGDWVAKLSQSFEAPSFARNMNILGTVKYLCDIENVEQVAKDYQIRKTFSNITIEDNPYNAFLERIGLIEEYTELKQTPYTKEKWYLYISNSLSIKNLSKKSLNDYITALVELSIELEKYLKGYNNAEIYTLSTNSIKELIFSCNSAKKGYEYYKFIGEVYKDLEIKKELNKINKAIGFNYLGIESPLISARKKKKEKKEPDDLISFKQWKEFFKFIIDTKYHIKEFLEVNDTSEKRIKYLSNWLYLALHLNNAWRHTDVTEFPRIFLADLCEEYKISSLEWFKNNIVTAELANSVIARVYKYELRVNKTDVKGNFFCSKDLVVPLATILLMFEMCYKFDYIGEYNNYQSPVMKFFTRYNSPNNHSLKLFISSYNSLNIKFSNRKMNKTIMDMMHRLSNGLDLPAYMRSHIDKNSPLYYTNISQEDLDFLSENLFARGEFGYIYDTLIDVKNGNSETKLKDKTTEIIKIKESFGDEIKVEATLGILNYFVNEKYELLNMINEGGITFAIETLNNLYLEKYPSKQKHVQCLYSKKSCMNIEIERCIDCKYAIPTIYAVNTICNALKEDLIAYNKSTSIPQRIRLSAKIQRKKQLLIECIKRYGREFIYDLLEISADEFKYILSGVENVSELYVKL